MKFIATPERDSDNSDPPDLEIEKKADGSVEFTFRRPLRTIRLSREDWQTLKHST
jgi:hypothetical protein